MSSSSAMSMPPEGMQEDLQAQARAWVVGFASGKPTAADAAIIRRWRAQSPAHEQAWVQACREWRDMGDATRSFAALYPRVARRPAPRMNRRAWLGAAVSAAGALSVAAVVRPPLGLWPSWSEMHADYRTATGEQRNVELDGTTRLSLNTQTSLAVRSDSQALRLELIAGEAALSARRTSPCEIAAAEGVVSTTVGDIEVRYLDDSQVRVRCNAGAARLRHPAGDLALQAGQEVRYDARGIQVPGRIATESEWRQGLLVFRNLPLADVVEEINRYRPGRVVLLNKDLARERLSANFSIKDLDEAIGHIQHMYPVKVRRVGDLVLLT